MTYWGISPNLASSRGWIAPEAVGAPFGAV
jgi:hypothetical protein